MSMFVGLSAHAVAANRRQRLNLCTVSGRLFSCMEQGLLTLQARESLFQDARTADSHLSVNRSRLNFLCR